MNNEEAIERLTYIKTHDTDPEDYELFDLAIKALEKSEVKGDLISREALKKYARVVFDKDLGRLRVVDVSDIDNAPTGDIKDEIAGAYNEGYMCGSREAEKARPQGEWIMQRHDLDGCFYTCSNCGRMIRVPLFIDDPDDNETLADYPFCHCGAKMKGGEEE